MYLMVIILLGEIIVKKIETKKVTEIALLAVVVIIAIITFIATAITVLFKKIINKLKTII